MNKLITSFINITNVLDKVKRQDVFDNAQRLRTYTNKQLAATPTDTDKSKPETKKRWRK